MEKVVRSVLVLDDHPFASMAVEAALRRVDRSIKVVECGGTARAVEALRVHAYDLLLLDITVPGSVGLSFARHCVDIGLADRCAMFTGAPPEPLCRRARAMGLLGWVDKSLQQDELIDALQRLLNGESYFPKEVVPEVGALTERQAQILSLVRQGFTSREIGAALDITAGVVDNHVARAIESLGASHRAQAVSRAIELGYIDITRTDGLQGVGPFG